MRFVFVAHVIVRGDGQGRINLEIVEEALRRGHGVHLICSRADSSLIDRGATWQQVPVVRPFLRQVVAFSRAADRAIISLRKTKHVDRVVGNGYTLTEPHELNLCQFVHAAWLGSPAHNQGGLVNRIYQQTFTRFNVLQEKKAFKAARIIVTPSNRTADELHEIGIEADKIRLIPNGVDTDEFYPATETVDRRSLGLPADVPIALFVGDLRTNRKGIRQTLEAMTHIHNAHLAVVGRSNRSPFVAFADKLGIASRVHFLNFRSDIPQIMRACDIFVFPTSYDPFGLVVLEAMASGLPVVTAANAGASEIMDARGGTILQDAGEVPAITRAMEHWLNDKRAAQEAKIINRQSALQNGWLRMASRYVDLIEISGG